MKKCFLLLIVVIIATMFIGCATATIRGEKNLDIEHDILSFNKGGIILNSQLSWVKYSINFIDSLNVEDLQEQRLNGVREFRESFPDKECLSMSAIVFPSFGAWVVLIDCSYIKYFDDGSVKMSFLSDVVKFNGPIEEDPDKDKNIEDLIAIYGYRVYKNFFSEAGVISALKEKLYKEIFSLEGKKISLYQNKNEEASKIISDLADLEGNKNGVATPFEIFNLFEIENLADKYPQEVGLFISTTKRYVVE